MNKQSALTSIADNAWIIHREEIDIALDGRCNVYALLDAVSGYCFGMECTTEQPTTERMAELLEEAYKVRNRWPQQVLILKSDPFLEFFDKCCTSYNLVLSRRTPKELRPHTQSFSQSFRKFSLGKNHDADNPLTKAEEEELEAFVPDTYSPCPCASGKKFKFCCQKIFKDISFAMCAAEEGNIQEALHHMREAESKVGRTAEICCRFAICWSFTDKNKYHEYLSEAEKIDKNHPRLNYLLGIEAVANSQFNLAVDYYKKAIDNYPKNDKFHLNETYNNLGTAHYRLKNYEAAKEVWEKGSLLLPSDKMTINNLVECIYDNPEVPKQVRGISSFIRKKLDANENSGA